MKIDASKKIGDGLKLRIEIPGKKNRSKFSFRATTTKEGQVDLSEDNLESIKKSIKTLVGKK